MYYVNIHTHIPACVHTYHILHTHKTNDEQHAMHELFRARKVELKTQRTVAAVARAAREEGEAAKVFFF